MGAGPRILYIDIETAPAIIAAFPPLHETNAVWVERSTYILGFAAMWDGDRRPQTYFLPDYPLFKKDIHSDKALCADLYHLLNECDIVVAHNGDRFDLKIINARLLINGFPPPSPRKTIDTLKGTRGVFRLDSAKLDACGQATGVGRKLATTGKDLWRDCYHGDRKQFKVMAEYCRQDTQLLHDYFKKIRAWIPHPDLRLYADRGSCPTCLSENVQRRGVTVARSRIYQRFQCQDCARWFSGQQEKHHAQNTISPQAAKIRKKVA